MSIKRTNASATHTTNMSMAAVMDNMSMAAVMDNMSMAAVMDNMSMAAVMSKASVTHTNTRAITALGPKGKKKLAVKVDDLTAVSRKAAQSTL